MAKVPIQLDMFRNTAQPMPGYAGWPFGYSGSCLTAQAAVFHQNLLDEFDVHSALWRICWLPNITNGNQTAIRLISADSGPSNIAEVVATYSGQKPNSPLNEAFDITDQMRLLVTHHVQSNSMFQFVTQACGDGTFGPLIYSSALELVVRT